MKCVDDNLFWQMNVKEIGINSTLRMDTRLLMKYTTTTTTTTATITLRIWGIHNGEKKSSFRL